MDTVPTAPSDARTLHAREDRFGTVGALTFCFVVVVLSAYNLAWFDSPSGTSFQDRWFGTDIQRHIDWATDWRKAAGAPLHPASFVAYKLSSPLLTLVGSLGLVSYLLLYSLPHIVSTGLALGLGARLLRLKGYSRWSTVAAFVILGSFPILGCVPESHTAGGAWIYLALCACAPAIGSFHDEDTRHRRRYWAILGILAATGYTISNMLVASVAPCCLARSRWRSFLVLAIACAALASAFLVGVGVKHQPWTELDAVAAMGRAIRAELSFVVAPRVGTLWVAFNQLYIAQFGGIETNIGVAVLDPAKILRPSAAPGLLQSLAALFSFVATAVYCSSSKQSREMRLFVVACGVGILTSVAIHTVYAPYEAFLFSPHTWPFVACPAIVIVHTTRSRLVVTLLASAAFLAVVQSLRSLFEIAGHLH